jgi:hypothetical protein
MSSSGPAVRLPDLAAVLTPEAATAPGADGQTGRSLDVAQAG